MTADFQVHDLIGEKLDPDDEKFLSQLEELFKSAISEPVDGAKQVITTNGLLLTVYFVAISFGKFKEMSHENGAAYMFFTCLFCIPVLLFLISTFFALRVYIPVTHYPTILSPLLLLETYQNIINYRYKQLKWAIFSMEFGFLLLLVCFSIYMMAIPNSDNIIKIDLINKSSFR
jgi:hypothetical protein